MGKVVVSIWLFRSLVIEFLSRDLISSSFITPSSLHLCLFQVKPAKAGSSIGVKVAFGVNDSIKKAIELILEVSCFFCGLDSISRNLDVKEWKSLFLETGKSIFWKIANCFFTGN